jgi:chemotaxis signal transduction protein
LASTESTTEPAGRRLLLFGVSGTLCACDIDAVREIVTARPTTRLPGAPVWVRGIMNLRGTLLTVVDLAVRFGAPPERAAPPTVVVVLDAGGKTFGLGVDAVQGVQTVGPDAWEAADPQRSAGGIVSALAHVGEARRDTAMVCSVEAIARESLA